MLRPPTRYTAPSHPQIAYQVLGDGPVDLVYLNGLTEHIDLQWGHPRAARFLEGLASFSRLILFDRRGAGASDPIPDGQLSWENWTNDLRDVLDETSCQRALLVAEIDAGPMAMLFAASDPHRVRGLVLVNTAARYLWAPDYECGLSEARSTHLVELFRSTWGTEDLVKLTFPSMAEDRDFCRWRAQFSRASATPYSAARQYDYMLRLDIRSVLPSIQAPTLILHRADFAFVPIEFGRYLARQIPEAKFVEMPGRDAWLFTEDADVALQRIAGFATGSPRRDIVERRLATILFTDIVGSTALAGKLGDQRWKELLREHDHEAATTADQYNGVFVKTLGDGALMRFDGPTSALLCAETMRQNSARLGLSIRCGLHAGEVEATEHDIQGLAVHIAARVLDAAMPDSILVSRTVRDLAAGSGFCFRDLGMHAMRGLDDEWQLYAVDDVSSNATPERFRA